MVRLLKIAKVQNKMVKDLNDVLKIGVGFERMVFLLITFLLLVHVASCIWIFVAIFDDSSKQNWIYAKGFVDLTDF